MFSTAAHWGILGQELEPESEEAPIGKFSVDLLARDTGTNRAVIKWHAAR